MVGIRTRYSGPTDYKGSKITVTWADTHGYTPEREIKRGTYEYEDALDSGDNHFYAAKRFLERTARGDHWQITGRIDDDQRGYLFVCDYVA